MHPDIGLGFLASPPLVIAFALAGDAECDVSKDPIANLADGRLVFLADLWPGAAEIDAVLARAMSPDDVAAASREAERNPAWADLEAPKGSLWPWDLASTYIRRPPFARAGAKGLAGTLSARPMLVLGDDITTDHISPAGQIPARSAAGGHLVAAGETPTDLNVFAARRGNWEVMVRGVFTNRAVVNRLVDGLAPGTTVHAPTGRAMPLLEAAELYAREGCPLVIVAGERYGMGSSRDWAAKGVALLGVRAVLAKSFERIHRSNLIGMGLAPILLPADVGIDGLAITASTIIEIPLDRLAPRASIPVRFAGPRGAIEVECRAAIETAMEARVLQAGGYLPMVIKGCLAS